MVSNSAKYSLTVEKAIFWISLVLLFFITFFNQSPLVWDEALFPKNVLLLEKYGLSKIFLLEMYDQAPGPLYQFIHYPLIAITHLEPPGIRLVNFLFVIFILVLLYLINKHIFSNKKELGYLNSASNLLAIPLIWLVVGLALTEIPAMLFATLATFLIIRFIISEQPTRIKYLCSILAGISIGLAVLGRTPYLMMLPALFLLMFFNRQNIKFFIIIILTSVPLFLPVFMIWEGLVPPAQKHTAEGFVDIWHGILGFAYLSLFILIVSPGYFKIKRKEIPIYLIALVGFFILNLLIFKFQYSPLSITLSKFMPAAFMDFYPFLIAPMFGVIVLIFIVVGTRKLIENRLNPQFIFIMLCMILITATSFKITHLFSSRYVVQVAPFIVILSGYYESFNYGKHIRYIIGVVIGLLSYLTYANFHI